MGIRIMSWNFVVSVDIFLIVLILIGTREAKGKNYTSRDDIRNVHGNLWRSWVWKPTIYSLHENASATEFKDLCTSRQAVNRCAEWDEEDIKYLRYAQEKVTLFQDVLSQYYDISFQLLWVVWSYSCGLYLIWHRHFSFHDKKDIHYVKPPVGIKYFIHRDIQFLVEEVKTIIQTDSEDEEMIPGNNLSDYVTESSGDERSRRKNNPHEYGVLKSRRVRHTDELINPKYKQRTLIQRKKKGSQNANNVAYGTTFRNFKPPISAGKKFDNHGTPKYPIIYEMRRELIYTNNILERL